MSHISKRANILITGSTDGIGYKAAIELAKEGYHVIVHGRTRKKAEVTLEKIKGKLDAAILSCVHADFSSLSEVKEMAEQIHQKLDKLDVLINNAGVIKHERTLTDDGIEKTLAVNYVSHFLLTNLARDLLEKADSGRIVNVVSRVHSNHFDFDDLPFDRGYTAVKAYARSKTALIMFTYLLAEKLEDTHITANCLHPGVINTKLLKTAFGAHGAPLIEGAKTLIYAATSPELDHVSGKYLVNNRPTTSKDITYEIDFQEKLWEKTEDMVGMRFS